jgi:transposase
MFFPAYTQRLRKDVRLLRIYNAQLIRSQQLQKQKADDLQKENDYLKRENEKLRKREQTILEELEKIKQERDSYKNMVFKSKRTCTDTDSHNPSGRKRGGQIGHRGTGRKIPEIIHQHVHVYLTNCSHCDAPLTRVEATDTHTVIDVPHWSLMQPKTIQYTIERQWCNNCHKEVRAVPHGVIPGSRLGVNLLTMALVWHYRFREPFNKIVERLWTQYGIHVSEGTLVAMAQRAKEWFGSEYDNILEEIRGSPVKHGDETGWRVNGENWWCWVAVTKKSVYYTIEDSRGGGIARDIFQGAIGILVRDDYAGYKALSLLQQSCWTHLLRVSHTTAEQENASEEAKQLHKKLVILFGLLSEDIVQPFKRRERKLWYSWYKKDIENIINTTYTANDVKKVQTRISNQNTNLLTALLYEGVPLTNNAAERAVRPVVVTRKISGGSKTKKGAQSRAVNMSIIETIVKRKKPLLDTVQSYLLNNCIKSVGNN